MANLFPGPPLPLPFPEMINAIIDKVHETEWPQAAKAQIVKSLGGVHEVEGRTLDAVQAYEFAAFLHPKVGVAKKLRALRRQLKK